LALHIGCTRNIWFRASVIKAGGLAALLIFLTAGLASAASPLAILDVRFGVHPTYTRVVLDLSANAQPKVFGLVDPYRMVIELPEPQWPRLATAADAGGLVTRTRWSTSSLGVGQVVLDLTGPVQINAQMLLAPADGAPWRFVLDLAPGTKETFAQAAASPQPRPKPRELTVPPRRKPVVVIDPGHGGVDPGTIGPSGVPEKDLVLAYARSLREALLATGRIDVVMTRDSDVFVPLRERNEAAHAAGADLFVSLHVDSEPTHSSRGLSLYILSEHATDAEAAALAAQENKADIIAGVDLGKYPAEVANILIDFAQAKTNEMSMSFARDYVLAEIGPIAPLVSRPLKSAGFAVLKLPDVPSILVELGYLSHSVEEKTLLREDHRRRIAQAAAKAIDRYFSETKQLQRP
jgi:N-acetylmuramoyl-L-alanine amidase